MALSRQNACGAGEKRKRGTAVTMGLFPSANDFKAGKGVEKDAPRKTGIGRFFELVGRDMNGMFLAKYF